MAQSNEKMSNLVAYTVSADHERPDLEACLEISDRVNGTKPECIEAINSIIKCLLSSNYKVVLNTTQLLETLCKNCNMRFLYELNNKKLVDAIMKILEKRRLRAKSKSTSSKPVDKVKVQVEEKVLYLMQLWADTFMMHQEEFANVHTAYRTLRKEGIKFPDRDPNEKFMMNFQGQVSPIFLAMNEDYIVPSNNQGGPVPDPRKQNAQTKYTSKEPEYRHEVNPSSRAVNTLYNEEDEYDYSVYDGVEISRDEVRVLEESTNILKEIEANATVPGDMKSEIANEILADLVHVHKRIKRLVHSDKFASTSQRSEALRINDMINSCLASYKARYTLLKDNYNKGIKSEPLAPPPGTNNDEKDSPNGDGAKRKTSAEGQKPAFVGMRKLAPPKGWKAPKEEHNPDLIDLMSGGDEPSNKTTPAGNEEKKEDVQPKIQEKQSRNLMDEFLEMNFNQPAPAQNNNNFGFNFGQMPPQQSMPIGNPMFMGNMYQQGFNQPLPNQFTTAPMYPQGQNPAMMNGGGFANSFDMFATQQIPVRTSLGVNTNTGGASPLQIQSPITPQVLPQTHPQGSLSSGNSPIVQQQGAAHDDDDFFSDIANRKK